MSGVASCRVLVLAVILGLVALTLAQGQTSSAQTITTTTTTTTSSGTITCPDGTTVPYDGSGAPTSAELAAACAGHDGEAGPPATGPKPSGFLDLRTSIACAHHRVKLLSGDVRALFNVLPAGSKSVVHKRSPKLRALRFYQAHRTSLVKFAGSRYRFSAGSLFAFLCVGASGTPDVTAA
jgi:hypothetical protein